MISTLRLLLDKFTDRIFHHASWKGYWEVLMQQVRPAWRDGYFRARVVTVKKLSTDMLEVLLIPERSWPTHVAGQHIAITIEINGRPLLMIVGGSGITPFIAMLDDAVNNAQLNHTPVHLLYFAKPDEHVLLNELSAFSQRCEHFTYDILSKQKDGDVEAHLCNFANAHWLVCGPHAMFEQVESYAKAINVPVSSEHFAALPVVSNTSLTKNETFSWYTTANL